MWYSSSRSISSAQVDGQSCGQALKRMSGWTLTGSSLFEQRIQYSARDEPVVSAAPGCMIRRLSLVMLALALAGCLDFTRPRVTVEQRQILNLAGVVVLLPPHPRLHEIAPTATASTTGSAALAGWDVGATVGAFLGERLA